MANAKKFPRLDQLIASLGYGSRSEVAYMIKNSRVEVKGHDKPKPDLRVDPKLVRLDGEDLDHPEGLLILMHKPVGYVCSHTEKDGETVYSLLPERWNYRSPKVVSVGRLDKDTSGLLLLSDQHELVHELTSPKKHVTKTYEVTIDGELNQEMIEIFASGKLMLHGEAKPCMPAELKIIDAQRAELRIHEGRYHQVRRMFAALGIRVLTLHRSYFGKLSLENIAAGEFRSISFEKLS